MLRSFHARPVSKVIIIASLLVFTLMSDTFAAAPTKRVRILFADFSERMGLFFVAKDQHFFEEHGLEADLVQVNSGPVAVAAMAANEAEFYTVSATGSALGAMVSGLDLVWVAGMINKLDGYFYVAPKIQKPDDLKGKIIGVQSIGGGIWMFTMMTFDHWGISPERDKIQLRVIGDQSVLVRLWVPVLSKARFWAMPTVVWCSEMAGGFWPISGHSRSRTKEPAWSHAEVLLPARPTPSKRRLERSSKPTRSCRTGTINRRSSAACANGCGCRPARIPTIFTNA